MSQSNNPTGGGGNRFIPTEQRQEGESTRRSGEDRREDGAAFENEDKRDSSDRRMVLDRRTMGLEVPCKTSGSIESVEDWLDDNCNNDWQVVLDKVGKNLNTKHLLVMFETEADRDIFLDKYLQDKQ
jgi:hypothetical protein